MTQEQNPTRESYSLMHPVELPQDKLEEVQQFMVGILDAYGEETTITVARGRFGRSKYDEPAVVVELGSGQTRLQIIKLIDEPQNSENSGVIACIQRYGVDPTPTSIHSSVRLEGWNEEEMLRMAPDGGISYRNWTYPGSGMITPKTQEGLRLATQSFIDRAAGLVQDSQKPMERLKRRAKRIGRRVNKIVLGT